MNCIVCGTKLPANARFCMACGAKIENRDKSGIYTLNSSMSDTKKNMSISSLKMQEIVYISGKGIYFIKDEESVCKIEEGSNKVQHLTKKSAGNVRHLGCWNGSLYYWKCGEDDQLFQINLDSGEKKLLKLKGSKYKPDISGHNRFMIKNGIGYGIHCSGRNNNKLIMINLSDETVIMRDLPDMRLKMPPWSWEQKYIVANENKQDLVNYGEKYEGFGIDGKYGYVSISSSAQYTLRFLLDDPSVFTYLPENSCTAIRDVGMFSQWKDYIVGGYEALDSKLYIYNVVKNNCQTIDLKKYLKNITDIKGWWRMGDTYFVGNMRLNLTEMKLYKIPFEIYVQDFLELPDGSVYIIRGNQIYHLPKSFWEFIHDEEDLEKWLVANW